MINDTERILISGRIQYVYDYLMRNSDVASYGYSENPIRRELDLLLSEREEYRLSAEPVDIDIALLITWCAQIYNHRVSNESRYTAEGRWNMFVPTMERVKKHFNIEVG